MSFLILTYKGFSTTKNIKCCDEDLSDLYGSELKTELVGVVELLNVSVTLTTGTVVEPRKFSRNSRDMFLAVRLWTCKQKRILLIDMQEHLFNSVFKLHRVESKKVLFTYETDILYEIKYLDIFYLLKNAMTKIIDSSEAVKIT